MTAWHYFGGGFPDATTVSKGAIQLAGDLGGTAARPTVPGLATLGASKANVPTVVDKAGNYVAKAGDVVLVDASAAAVDVTLPAAAAGATVTVKKTDASANAVTISGGTIDGAAQLVLATQWDHAALIADGNVWSVIG